MKLALVLEDDAGTGVETALPEPVDAFVLAESVRTLLEYVIAERWCPAIPTDASVWVRIDATGGMEA